MSRSVRWPLAALAAWGVLAPTVLEGQEKPSLPKPDAEGWVSLFNGKDLSQWKGDPKIWKVRDGAIRGQGTGLNHNSFLVTRHSFSDFVLEARFIVPREMNSGIQYRSWLIAPSKWIVGGYQADIGTGCYGNLFDEGGRGYLTQPVAEVARSIKLNAWNRYVIRAEGTKLTHWINGIKASEFVDKDGKARRFKGILALQYHAPGGPEVRFKDIRIKLLKR